MKFKLYIVGQAWLAGACLVFASTAYGDAGDVFNLSLAQTLTYDNNLFKLSPQADTEAVTGASGRSDAISRSELRLAADKPVGGQMLHAALGVSRLRYQRFRRLDDDLNDYSTSWDWALGRLWSGLLSASRAEASPGFSDFRAAVRDRVTTDTTTARAVLRFHPGWQLSFAAMETRRTHAAEANAYSDSRVDSAETALRYAPGTGNEMGLRVRHAQGSFPNRQLVNGFAVDNGYTEDGLEVDGAWQVSGASRLQAALGRTQRQHNDAPGRDFSGPAGRVSWDWQPTGQTSIGVSARREAGAQDDLAATLVVTDGLRLSAVWRPTATLSFNVSAEARRRRQQGDAAGVLTGAPEQQDDDRIFSLGAGYAPLRNLQLGIDWHDERRVSNVADFSYRTRQLSFSAQLLF